MEKAQNAISCKHTTNLYLEVWDDSGNFYEILPDVVEINHDKEQGRYVIVRVGDIRMSFPDDKFHVRRFSD